MTRTEADPKEGTNPYIFYGKRAHVLDARPYKRLKARKFRLFLTQIDLEVLKTI
jgi:hypothetical protein